MKITGTSHFTADPEAVWHALNDPAVLVRTIPGCQRLEALGDDAYKMRVSAGVGSIKGVYDGNVRLTDQEQPGSFRMHAQGAGPPGTIGADVLVTLADGASGGTDLTYDAEATVGGMIGGVGQRMLTGVSKKMAAEFFDNVDQVLTSPAAPAAGPAEASEAPGSLLTSEVAPANTPAGPTESTVGQVFAAPAAAASTGTALGDRELVVGVAIGAVAALTGALVGGWLSRRRN